MNQTIDLNTDAGFVVRTLDYLKKHNLKSRLIDMQYLQDKPTIVPNVFYGKGYPSGVAMQIQYPISKEEFIKNLPTIEDTSLGEILNFIDFDLNDIVITTISKNGSIYAFEEYQKTQVGVNFTVKEIYDIDEVTFNRNYPYFNNLEYGFVMLTLPFNIPSIVFEHGFYNYNDKTISGSNLIRLFNKPESSNIKKPVSDVISLKTITEIAKMEGLLEHIGYFDNMHVLIKDKFNTLNVTPLYGIWDIVEKPDSTFNVSILEFIRNIECEANNINALDPLTYTRLLGENFLSPVYKKMSPKRPDSNDINIQKKFFNSSGSTIFRYKLWPDDPEKDGNRIYQDIKNDTEADLESKWSRISDKARKLFKASDEELFWISLDFFSKYFIPIFNSYSYQRNRIDERPDKSKLPIINYLEYIDFDYREITYIGEEIIKYPNLASRFFQEGKLKAFNIYNNRITEVIANRLHNTAELVPFHRYAKINSRDLPSRNFYENSSNIVIIDDTYTTTAWRKKFHEVVDNIDQLIENIYNQSYGFILLKPDNNFTGTLLKKTFMNRPNTLFLSDLKDFFKKKKEEKEIKKGESDLIFHNKPITIFDETSIRDNGDTLMPAKKNILDLMSDDIIVMEYKSSSNEVVFDNRAAPVTRSPNNGSFSYKRWASLFRKVFNKRLILLSKVNLKLLQKEGIKHTTVEEFIKSENYTNSSLDFFAHYIIVDTQEDMAFYHNLYKLHKNLYEELFGGYSGREYNIDQQLGETLIYHYLNELPDSIKNEVTHTDIIISNIKNGNRGNTRYILETLFTSSIFIKNSLSATEWEMIKTMYENRPYIQNTSNRVNLLDIVRQITSYNKDTYMIIPPINEYLEEKERVLRNNLYGKLYNEEQIEKYSNSLDISFFESLSRRIDLFKHKFEGETE